MPEVVVRERQTLDHIDAIYKNKSGKTLLSFCSNDYLGLANHPDIISAATDHLNKHGMGARSSVLLSGYSSVHEQLELELAAFFGFERALVFSTGYMANLAVISTLFDSTHRIALDRRCHASIYDGVLLSRAKFTRFRTPQPMPEHHAIITEGVFSMDGDFAPLDKITTMVGDDQLLIVDDAHGIGWAGVRGRGSFEVFGCEPKQNHILMGTMSKTFGCHGAFVAGSFDVIEELIQDARPYIYTTSLPPHIFASARTALKILDKENWRREKLNDNISYFQTQAKDRGLSVLPSSSPIQVFVIKDSVRTMAIKNALENEGIMTQAIRPPTVPNNSSRIRISLSALHEHSHIDQLLEALAHATT